MADPRPAATLHLRGQFDPMTLRVAGPELDRPVCEVLRRHAMPLNTRCGQKRICRGCLLRASGTGLLTLDTGTPVDGEVLGCAVRLAPEAELTLDIPPRSLMAYRPQVIDQFRVEIPTGHAPIWDDDRSDLARPVGAAIDIGTTTVAVLIVDLKTGEVLGRASAFNRQMHLGDDVLARIQLCLNDEKNLERLQAGVVRETIAPLLDDALRMAGLTRDDLVVATVAANTTMLHLLAGESPAGLGLVPFTPAFLEYRQTPISTLHFFWPHEKRAWFEPYPGYDVMFHLLPSAGAYVGADVVAGVVATGLLYDDGPSLLIDVGTNGEIVLKHGELLLGCATAAGPAFEGAGLSNGVRAGDGAISHIRFTGNPPQLDLEVIGNTTPIGICGTGYIDFIPEARKAGIINDSGRFVLDNPAIEPYLEQTPHGRSLRIAEGAGGEAIHIAETDIASLIQAKAAIAAGVLTLLDRAGLKPSDLKTVHLAGGFGLRLDLDHAIDLGLLPGIAKDQIDLAGNSSLAGAYLTLLDRGMLPEMADAAQRMEVIELNLEPTFEDHYIDQLTATAAPGR